MVQRNIPYDFSVGGKQQEVAFLWVNGPPWTSLAVHSSSVEKSPEVGLNKFTGHDVISKVNPADFTGSYGEERLKQCV